MTFNEEWSELIGPDDDPTWMKWCEIWEAETDKAIAAEDIERAGICQRRVDLCTRIMERENES